MTRPALDPSLALGHRPWRRGSDLAVLVPGRTDLSVDDVRRGLRAASAAGYREALSPALEPSRAEPWLVAGFAVHEALVLYHRELTNLPEQRADAPALRAARALDRRRVVRIDQESFDDPFWQFDEVALGEALATTPVRRFRIDRGRRGYAISGVAGARAFLQRLAVREEARRSGVGRALTVDALRWATRKGARTLSVNTQERNVAARALYEGLAFEVDADRLLVLRCATR